MKECFFFIGTEAELIKVFPVILECQNSGITCHIIASGQNDLKKSRILSYIKLSGEYVELSRESDIKKNARGLLRWFFRTKRQAAGQIMQCFNSNELRDKPLVVHGDTVSTLMGALIGRKLKMKICHIEAGLRSHHIMNPFPEEIDRMLTSSIARIHFAPGEQASNNLKKARGIVIDTKYNTILDSLAISEKMPIITENLQSILIKEYFVFVMHRQENLMNREFVKEIIEKIIEVSKERKCVLILHQITENTFAEMGILKLLKGNDNFILLSRVDYFDFMKLLNSAQFVITDGGSNQEELHYMGKPCLIMRKATEREEGIGENAQIYQGNTEQIMKFNDYYKEWRRTKVVAKISPSKMIADYIDTIA